MANEPKVGGVSPRPSHSTGAATASRSGRRIGGVSSKMAHETYAAQAAGPTPASPAHSDFIWNGGPVITCPLIYATFWGPSWTTSPSALAEVARLSQFLQDLVNSQFMNVLSQYGSGNGPGTGLYMQASFISSVAASVSDTDIHHVIQGAINAGAIPEPPAKNTTQVIVIYLDSSIAVKDTSLGISMCEPSGDTAFGYHFFFTTTKGNPCYYSVIPSLDDTCLKNTDVAVAAAPFRFHKPRSRDERRSPATSLPKW
jgi:hypothetical protein